MANDRSWLISALCITLSTSLFCDFSAVDTFGCSLIHNRSIITPHSTPIGPPKYFNRSVLSTQSGWPSIPPKAKFFYPLGRFFPPQKSPSTILKNFLLLFSYSCVPFLPIPPSTILRSFLRLSAIYPVGIPFYDHLIFWADISRPSSGFSSFS